jgi:tetratricopeptide (TPR) repeat protein
MMRKFFPVLVVTLVLFSFVADPTLAASHMKKGKDFYAVLNYAQAEQEFARAIEGDPRDQEAYFLRGMCLLQLGYRNDAQKSFRSSVAASLLREEKVGKAFLYIDPAGIADIVPVLDGALKKNRKLGPTFAEDIFSVAKEALNGGNLDGAKRLIDLSLRYDGGLSGEVFNHVLRSGDSKAVGSRLACYDLALVYA